MSLRDLSPQEIMRMKAALDQAPVMGEWQPNRSGYGYERKQVNGPNLRYTPSVTTEVSYSGGDPYVYVVVDGQRIEMDTTDENAPEVQARVRAEMAKLDNDLKSRKVGLL